MTISLALQGDAPGVVGAVRPAAIGDRDPIRTIFASTLALGRPVTLDGMDAYADFSLDWYLEQPEDRRRGHALVHDVDGTVTGYVLVCTDERAYERAQRLAAARYLRRLLWRWLAGDLDGPARHFHRLRIRDGWDLYRNAPVRPADAHLHLNLVPGARSLRAARALVDAADDLVAGAGHDAWYAEINAPVGRRANALQRLGAEVIHRSANATLTAMVGEPVERLTILRRL